MWKIALLGSFGFWVLCWFGGWKAAVFTGIVLWFILVLAPILATVGYFVTAIFIAIDYEKKQSLSPALAAKVAGKSLGGLALAVLASIITLVVCMIVFSLGHWGWQAGINFQDGNSAEESSQFACPTVVRALPMGDTICDGIGR